MLGCGQIIPVRPLVGSVSWTPDLGPLAKGPSGDNRIASGVIGYGGRFTTRAELATGFG